MKKNIDPHTEVLVFSFNLFFSLENSIASLPALVMVLPDKSSTLSSLTNSTAGIGSSSDGISEFATIGATSGIGILRQTGSAVLKAEISALESLGLGKTISNPKVFTLDNQVATITQGEEIAYQATGS